MYVRLSICSSVDAGRRAAEAAAAPQAQPQAAGATAGRRAAGARRPTGRPCRGTVEAY